MQSATLILFDRFILRDLRLNYVRTGLTVCGIALGVAVLLAITLANDTAVGRFKDTVDRVSGKANLEIHSASTGDVDEKYLCDLQWLWMTGAKFTPVIDQNVIFSNCTNLAKKDEPLVQLLGIDMLADPIFQTYEGEDNSTIDSSELLHPGLALIGAKLAKEQHLKAGDTFAVLANEKKHDLKVGRVLSPRGMGGAFSGNLVVTDMSTAQDVLSMGGKVSRIEIVAPEPDLVLILTKLRNELPHVLSIERPERRGQQVDKMTRSFQYNLLSLTFIALMVSMFLIYNTMTISVIRRRPQIGTLRALGVSRTQILALFTMEALTLGAVGTSLGIGIGIGFAQGALSAVSQTFEHFYFHVPVEHVDISATMLALAFAIGMSATIAAAIAPALEAATVAPAEATRRTSYEIKSRRNALKLAVAGWIVLAWAAIAACMPAINGISLFGYVSSTFTICGTAMLMPQFLKLALPVLGRLAQLIFGAEGRLAARSLQGTLGRTSVSVASLMIGIAMMVSLAIMIGSFRKTVSVWIDQSLKADLWLQTKARAGGSRQARITSATLAKINRVTGILAVDAFVEHPIEYNGDPTNIAGADLAVVGKLGHLIFTEGEDAREICNTLKDDEAIVTESFAIRKNVKKGDLIKIQSVQGVAALHVRGVYYDYASDLGYIVTNRGSYAKLFHDDSISNCAIYIRPGANEDAVRENILKAIGTSSSLQIRTTRELRKEALKIFDRTFAITYALHTIAIIVALLAVMNALFALTMESKREFAILRYLGASGPQLRSIVLVEAGLLGALGNISGLLLGYILSLLLIYVINKQSFGWTVQFYFPIEFLLESALFVFITAIIAGLIPARLASRTLAPEVVRDE